MYMYVYICVCICVYIYIYIYVYIDSNNTDDNNIYQDPERAPQEARGCHPREPMALRARQRPNAAAALPAGFLEWGLFANDNYK